MRVIRFLTSPGIVMLALISAYVLLKVPDPDKARVFAIAGFGGFGAIELVAAANLALASEWRTRLFLAHFLNALGGFVLSYASTGEGMLMLDALGGIAFTAGLLLWQHELRRQLKS